MRLVDLSEQGKTESGLAAPQILTQLKQYGKSDRSKYDHEHRHGLHEIIVCKIGKGIAEYVEPGIRISRDGVENTVVESMPPIGLDARKIKIGGKECRSARLQDQDQNQEHSYQFDETGQVVAILIHHNHAAIRQANIAAQQ